MSGRCSLLVTGPPFGKVHCGSIRDGNGWQNLRGVPVDLDPTVSFVFRTPIWARAIEVLKAEGSWAAGAQ